jgi:hypothetical protein
MTPEVQTAVEELRAAFAGHRIDVVPEEQGGAYIIVHDLQLGDAYTPATSFVGFLITFQYPRADVYPHFIDAAVRRADGGGIGAGFSGPTTWPGWRGPVIQVSRRSNRLDPGLDTAATKLAKVLAWMAAQ